MEIIEQPNKYDHYFKILLLGSDLVGKSAFCKRIMFNYNYDDFLKSQSNYLTTIGIDFVVTFIKYLNKKFKLLFWDTAGQERFSINTNTYMKNCPAILIFYDSFNRNSFNKAKQLCEKAISLNKNSIKIIIRSKYELKVEPKKNNIDIVSDEEVLEYINNRNNIFFFHLSNFEKYESGINKIIEFILFQFIKNQL